jgi:hypothetical protein
MSEARASASTADTQAMPSARGYQRRSQAVAFRSSAPHLIRFWRDVCSSTSRAICRDSTS